MAPKTLLLASDLDHTMVEHKEPHHRRLLSFNHAWLANSAPSTGQKVLVFSTGRSPELFKQLWKEVPLLTPDVLICSVGSEIFYNVASPVPRALLASSTQQPGSPLAGISLPSRGPPGTPEGPEFLPDGSWEAFLDVGWDRAKAQALVEQHFPLLKPQVASEQRSHKASYAIDPDALPGGKAEAARIMEQLQKVLVDAGIKAKVIYSGGRDVDVLSEAAGKGRGLSFLLQRLKETGFEPANVQVAGDSGNDIELFEVPGVKGCVVCNAHPELRAFAEAQVAKGAADHICQATEPCASGILQAMRHFGLLQLPQPAPDTHLPPSPASGTSHQLLSHGGPGGSLPTAPAGQAASGDQVATLQAAQWLLLSGEVGAREFAWRLGTALVQALRENATSAADMVHHQALRLMLTNDCSIVLHPPGSSQSRQSLSPAGADAVTQEVQHDLEPVAVQEAGEAHTVAGAWIDELAAEQVGGASRSSTAAQGNKGSGALLMPGMSAWSLRFKIYGLSHPAGTRSGAVHEVEAKVLQQSQPVPHGFLAKTVQVWGPFGLDQVLPNIHAAKGH